jgi:hypothetical protein
MAPATAASVMIAMSIALDCCLLKEKQKNKQDPQFPMVRLVLATKHNSLA